MRNEPTNSDDVIDSRDIIARIDDLEGRETTFNEAEAAHDKAIKERAELPAKHVEDIEVAEAVVDEAGRVLDAARDDFDDADMAELKALRSLAEDCEGYASDWSHGETLIRRTYWVQYVQQLLEDIGDLPKDLPHYIAIDWDKTADNIEADYTTAYFYGVEYLIRCS